MNLLTDAAGLNFLKKVVELYLRNEAIVSLLSEALELNVLKSVVRLNLFIDIVGLSTVFLTESPVGLNLKSEGLLLLEGWNLLIEPLRLWD